MKIFQDHVHNKFNVSTLGDSNTLSISITIAGSITGLKLSITIMNCHRALYYPWRKSQSGPEPTADRHTKRHPHFVSFEREMGTGSKMMDLRLIQPPSTHFLLQSDGNETFPSLDQDVCHGHACLHRMWAQGPWRCWWETLLSWWPMINNCIICHIQALMMSQSGVSKPYTNITSRKQGCRRSNKQKNFQPKIKVSTFVSSSSKCGGESTVRCHSLFSVSSQDSGELRKLLQSPESHLTHPSSPNSLDLPAWASITLHQGANLFLQRC